MVYLLDAALTTAHTQQVESRFNRREAVKAKWRTGSAPARDAGKLHTTPVPSTDWMWS